MTVGTYGGPIPKTLLAACVARADAVHEVGNEGEDGYWVYLRPEWTNPDLECGTIHEYTVADTLRALRGIERKSK